MCEKNYAGTSNTDQVRNCKNNLIGKQQQSRCIDDENMVNLKLTILEDVIEREYNVKTFDDLHDAIESEFYHKFSDEYRTELNEAYPPVNLAGYEYGVGDCFKEVDPIAFRCGLTEYFTERMECIWDEIDKYGESRILGHPIIVTDFNEAI